MKVSIRKAFTNVASEKYDKKNLFFIFILLFVSSLASFSLPNEFQDINAFFSLQPEQLFSLYSHPQVSLCMGVILIISFLCNGCFVISVNNAIHKRNGIVPNPFLDILNVIVKSFLFSFGSFLVILLIQIVSFIFTFIIGLILGVLGLKPSGIVILLLVPFVILMVHAYICVSLRFLITLKFKDFFLFKKSWIMISKNIRRFASYFGKSLILLIVTCVLCSVVVFVFSLIWGIIGFVTQGMEIAKYALSAIASVFSSAMAVLLFAYMIDLTAQLLSPIVMKKKKKAKQITIETQK